MLQRVEAAAMISDINSGTLYNFHPIHEMNG